jgi:hypothetical protein
MGAAPLPGCAGFPRPLPVARPSPCGAPSTTGPSRGLRSSPAPTPSATPSRRRGRPRPSRRMTPPRCRSSPCSWPRLSAVFQHPDETLLVEAEGWALRALDADAGDARTFTALGLVRLHQSESRESARAFREALARDPREPEANGYLGRFLVASGYLDEGIARLEFALRRSPAAQVPAMNLATAYGLRGDFPRALEVLVRSAARARNVRAFLRLQGRMACWSRDAALAAQPPSSGPSPPPSARWRAASSRRPATRSRWASTSPPSRRCAGASGTRSPPSGPPSAGPTTSPSRPSRPSARCPSSTSAGSTAARSSTPSARRAAADTSARSSRTGPPRSGPGPRLRARR